MSGYVTLTGENFEAEVINSSMPVLIDFWASWCGPCKMIAPFLEQLANEYEGRIKIAKVNVDEESELATRHSINSIPLLVVYKNGAIAVQKAGAMPKQEIEKLFKGLI